MKIGEKLKEAIECCFCGVVMILWRETHNPAPLEMKEDARCCSSCNATKVIPERLRLIRFSSGKDGRC